MQPRDAFREILEYNHRFVGRDPDVLPNKLRKIAKNPFTFFRGTFHLFAADWVRGLCAPWTDGKDRERDPVIGDVHIESFGATEASSGEILFGLQDLDEATEADYDLDVLRAVASAALAVDQAGLPLSAACSAAARLAQGYADQAARFATGKDSPEWVVSAQAHAPEPIRELCARLAAVDRHAYMEGLCETVGNGELRQLRRGERHLAIRPERARSILEALPTYLRSRQTPGAGGALLLPADVVYRVAGTGGLGRFRYSVLLLPEGGGDGVALELKEAIPSALDLYRDRTHTDQAERVALRVREAQGQANRWLGSLRIGSQPYQVREIGPHDGHLSPSGFVDAAQADEVLECCGRLLAAAHHRGALAAPAGRCEVPAARLREREGLWLRRVVSFGLFYAAVAQEDHRAFCNRIEEALQRLTARA